MLNKYNDRIWKEVDLKYSWIIVYNKEKAWNNSETNNMKLAVLGHKKRG